MTASQEIIDFDSDSLRRSNRRPIFGQTVCFSFFLLVGRKDTYGNWKFRKIEKLWERKIENSLFCLWFGEWRVKCIYIAWVFVNWDGNFNAVLSIGFLCKGDNWVKLGQFGTYYCSKIKHLREKKKQKHRNYLININRRYSRKEKMIRFIYMLGKLFPIEFKFESFALIFC